MGVKINGFSTGGSYYRGDKINGYHRGVKLWPAHYVFTVDDNNYLFIDAAPQGSNSNHYITSTRNNKPQPWEFNF